VLKKNKNWNQTLMTMNDDVQHRIQTSENIQHCHHHEYENKITLRKNLKQPKKLKATKEQKISRATREQIKNNHKTNSKMKTS